MTNKTPPRPRKYPKQSRSQILVEAIQIACLQILQKEGSEQSLEKTLAALIDLEADQLLTLYKLNPDFFTEYSESYDVHGRVDEITQSMKNPSWKDWFPEFLAIYIHRLRPVDVNTLSFFARNTMRGILQAAVDEDPALLESGEFRLELLNLLLRYLVDEPNTEQ
jgi:hypothetical protein